MEFSYQSPLDGNAALGCQDSGDGLVVWSHNLVSVVMPPMRATWTIQQRAWYTARRDANLFGCCPLCGAMMPMMLRVGFTPVSVVHDDDCALVDPAWPEGMFSWAD